MKTKIHCMRNCVRALEHTNLLLLYMLLFFLPKSHPKLRWLQVFSAAKNEKLHNVAVHFQNPIPSILHTPSFFFCSVRFYCMGKVLSRVNSFLKGSSPIPLIGGENNEEWKLMVMLFSSCEHHLVSLTSPSTPFDTKKQWNIAFFLRIKLTHSISTSTFAVPNLLQNACKMLYRLILLPPVSDCYFCIDARRCHPLYLYFYVKHPRPIQSLIWHITAEQRWKGTFQSWSFQGQWELTARLKMKVFLSMLHANIIEEYTLWSLCGPIGLLG